MNKEEFQTFVENVINSRSDWAETSSEKAKRIADQWEKDIDASYEKGQHNMEEAYHGYVYMG